MSPGLIARKLGMSRIFLEGSGEAVAVTYLRVEPNTVVRTKSQEKDGYNAVVLGIGARTWKTRKGRELVRYAVQKEWQVNSLEEWKAGAEVTVSMVPAQSGATITGVSKGKGFQGVVKRHHFAGGPGSHGSHSHRRPGSIGMRTQPGRIHKGKKMAGRMGAETVTIHRRPVLVCDPTKGILGVKGPIPGANGSPLYLTIESRP